MDKLAQLLILKTMKKIVAAVLIGLALWAAIVIVANKKIDERSAANRLVALSLLISELR